MWQLPPPGLTAPVSPEKTGFRRQLYHSEPLYGETTPFTATGRIRTLRANSPGTRTEPDHGAVGPALGLRCWVRDPLPIPTTQVGHALGRRRERGANSGPGTLAVGKEGPRLGSAPLPATAPTPHSGAEVTAAGDPLGWEQCEDRVSHVEGPQKHLRSSSGDVGVGGETPRAPTKAGRNRFAFPSLKRPLPDWGWKHPRGWKIGHFIGLRSRTLLNPNPNLLDKEALAGAWGALCDWHPARDVCS